MEKPYQARKSSARLPYSPPAMIDYGDVVGLTRGESCSTCMDVGAGKVKPAP
jgi:hypothetical protein